MSNLNYLQLERLWIYAGGSASSAPTAAAVALAESRGSPTATNPSSATGLWQVETSAHPQYSSAQLLDPLQNARAAVAISGNGANWSPWQTYTNGAYKAFYNPSQTLLNEAKKLTVAFSTTPGSTLTFIGTPAQLAKYKYTPSEPDITQGPLGSLGTLASGVTGAAAAIAWIFNNWLRILEFLAGVVMIAYGVILLGKVGMAEV